MEQHAYDAREDSRVHKSGRGPFPHDFERWVDALACALRRGGVRSPTARSAAEDAVLRIQGALVLARARNEPACFGRALRRLRGDLRELLRRHGG